MSKRQHRNDIPRLLIVNQVTTSDSNETKQQQQQQQQQEKKTEAYANQTTNSNEINTKFLIGNPRPVSYSISNAVKNRVLKFSG